MTFFPHSQLSQKLPKIWQLFQDHETNSNTVASPAMTTYKQQNYSQKYQVITPF
jgi:hypothetical protein